MLYIPKFIAKFFSGKKKINPVAKLITGKNIVSNDRTKYFDWDLAWKLFDKYHTSTIEAGIEEDWGGTADIVFENGRYVRKHMAYLQSIWGTPVICVDGKFIKCWTYEQNQP